MVLALPHLSNADARRQRRRQLMVAGLLLLVATGAGFYIGERYSEAGLGYDPAEGKQLRRQLRAAESELAGLQGELDVAAHRREMDRQALELVRRELAGQKEQIASLEEGLRFYRSLMAPGHIAQGLSLRPLELVGSDKPGRIAFRVVIQQEASKHPMLKGELSVEVFGVLAGQEVSYPLAELSDDVEGDTIQLRFRYFQSIEGVLSLPEGFEPRFVRLRATASSPDKMEAGADVPWQLQEKFTHVGK